MSVSSEEHKFLSAFEREMSKGADGWLEVDSAADESGIDNKTAGALAARLKGRRYLEQRKSMSRRSDFRITPEGSAVLRSWWRRNSSLIITIGVAIVIAAITWFLMWYFKG